MLHLIPHNRIRIPNGLAMTAAIVLLISSVVDFDAATGDELSIANKNSAAKIESVENAGINTTAASKRRGLNLSFLLFRRG